MFLLSKWYLDCVTDDGDAVVIHSALMKRGILSVHYSALLFSRACGPSAERLSLRRAAAPVQSNGAFGLSLPRLGVAGRWSASTAGFRRIIHETATGQLAWSCHNPGGEVTIAIDGMDLQGQGYVEELTSTIEPWRLPFDELRWGRFIGSAERVTWIEWRGSHPQCLVVRDGQDQTGCAVSDGAIRFGSPPRVLELTETRLLRNGPLEDTAFQGMGLLRFVLPGRVRGAREWRWLSRGVLPGSTAGWAIHERVRW